ncbi:transcriptional regulator, MarR family [Fibrobacter sp. UWR3]|uniref:MarR family transcriptional regulator n=1 Tax=Fibrobacter sp. UWR3 TaxID=1896217 RepID=UPI00091FECA2|nr:MarR family transcriptional regulator [Fibrobacter sp. UWR3]SHN12458.1 transcriptional regulator, MarR family [Fibrobacter sp. UWR3]
MKYYNCGFLFQQIKQLQSRILDRKLSEMNVDAFNGAQGRILYVLWKNDGVPISEIARKTGLSMATLTGMLDRMEAVDLLHRFTDPNDRRKLVIRLTDKAYSLENDYNDVCSQMDGILFEGFKEKEIETLQALLERILKNLESADAQN